MKKVILCTVVSLFIFSGFVAGPCWGADLAKALTADQIEKMKMAAPSGAKAQITIFSDHKFSFQSMGPSFGHPKPGPTQGRAPQNALPGDPVMTPYGDIPLKLQYEVQKDVEFKLTTIKIYGDGTCVSFNGTLYCW